MPESLRTYVDFGQPDLHYAWRFPRWAHLVWDKAVIYPGDTRAAGNEAKQISAIPVTAYKDALFVVRRKRHLELTCLI